MDVPKRMLDEAQAETDETARVQVFRDHVALLKKLRVQVHCTPGKAEPSAIGCGRQTVSIFQL